MTPQEMIKELRRCRLDECNLDGYEIASMIERLLDMIDDMHWAHRDREGLYEGG